MIGKYTILYLHTSDIGNDAHAKLTWFWELVESLRDNNNIPNIKTTNASRRFKIDCWRSNLLFSVSAPIWFNGMIIIPIIKIKGTILFDTSGRIAGLNELKHISFHRHENIRVNSKYIMLLIDIVVGIGENKI